jgi:hypothetical protein
VQVPSAPSGRWLSFARVAWLAVALLILGLDAAGIPYAYARYKSVCTGAACDDVDRLAPERPQAVVDRRFYREKYDAAKALEQFSARLRDQTDLNDLQETMVRVVEETVQPQHVSLRLRSLERRR